MSLFRRRPLRLTATPTDPPPPTAKAAARAHGGGAAPAGAARPPRVVAEGDFVAAPQTIDALLSGDLPGDHPDPIAPLARLAGVSTRDNGTHTPLCFPMRLERCGVRFERVGPGRLRVTATAAASADRGCEMEAVAAVTMACLNLYDMAKASDQGLRIEAVRLVGRSQPSPALATDLAPVPPAPIPTLSAG